MVGEQQAVRTMEALFVIPCFNEEDRLNKREILRLLEGDDSSGLVLVDDGSSDGTLNLLREMQLTNPERIVIVEMGENRGKAEAVRAGLAEALGRKARYVAYLDADLATPVKEALRLLERLRASDADVLLASRVALLGRDIVRTVPRHYAGRLFASVASAILRLQVYDTQCGAKFFRVTPALERAIQSAFLSRWAFDVELISRLTSGPHPVHHTRIIEEPLLEWRDVAGSKLGISEMAGAGLDLGRIAWSLRDSRRSD